MEREHESSRRELRAHDPFWDLAPETVEWRKQYEGARYDVVKSREEYLHFAWPDGRIERVGNNPYILVFLHYDSLRRGCSQATRDTNVHADDLPLRELYARFDPPPRWIGLLREELVFEGDDDPRMTPTFQSYVVVEPPGARDGPAQVPKTVDRVRGSLEGTGWINPPPGAVTSPRPRGGLLNRLRGRRSG